MRGFSRRSTVAEAFAWLEQQIAALPAESVPLAAAAGRVLTAPVVSRFNVPNFSRAMMDGYAVRAVDTSGASIYNRLSLSVIGEVLPGQTFSRHVGESEAVRIMTGAALPPGADAVVPAEKADADQACVQLLEDVSPGKNVGSPGEDVACGTTVLPSGRLLRPQDLGVLSSIGVAEVSVVRRPRVRIIVTGNELLPAGSEPVGVRIVDANGPMLTALVARDGGDVINPGLVRDEPSAIQAALQTDADVILVSGGSSVGQEDHAPGLVSQLGELAIHGVAMRPSSPAGMGKIGSRLVFLLPGNPVSCLCAYDFFAGRAIRGLGGRQRDWPYRRELRTLARKLVSTVGRVDYARVKIADDGRVEPLAISGAAILSSTTRADGFVVVPEECEGYAPGTPVNVFLYD